MRNSWDNTGNSSFVATFCRLLQSTSTALADWYFYSGQPVLAACCHLAVGDVKVRALERVYINCLIV